MQRCGWVGAFYVLVAANKHLVVFAVLAKCSNKSSYQTQNTSVKDQVYINPFMILLSAWAPDIAFREG